MTDNMSLNQLLSTTHENLLKGVITPKDASDVLSESKVKTAINAYVNKDKINNLVPYFPEDLQNIYLIILISQYIYNNSGENTSISDLKYDTLYEIMMDNGGTDVVSSPVIANREVVNHKYPELRGSLDKIYYLSYDEKQTNPSRKYLGDWIKSAEDKIIRSTGKSVSLDDEEVYVFPKWDGVSGTLEFGDKNNLERALTRGDVSTNEATDITKMLEHYTRRSHKVKSPHGIKTEIMMRDSDLTSYNKEYGTDYKNTRSIVSSILNSKEIDDRAKYLVLQELRIQEDGKGETLSDAVFNEPFIKCRLSDIELIRKFSDKCHEIDGLRCDGCVIYIINPEIRKALGREDNINKSEVAYKFTEEVTMSKIKDIEFQMGLYGTLTPVAKIKKVKLKGNTIRSISLGSMGRFTSLGLAKGDTVKVLYDIIPYLVFDNDCDRSGNKPIRAPEYCPECDSELVLSDTAMTLSCDNDKCPCREKGKILSFLERMKIRDISYATVDDFYNAGILRNIKDIYNLKKKYSEITKLDGYGEVSYNNMINEIESRKKVTASKLLGAIGIESVGERIFDKILEIYTLDEVLDICKKGKINKLIAIKGIKEKTATKIIVGVDNEIDTIKFLIKKLDIYVPDSKDDIKFTAYLTQVRSSELKDFIESHGGEISKRFNKSTSMLIVPNRNIESAKIPQAEKFGIPVIEINDAEEYIMDNYGK